MTTFAEALAAKKAEPDFELISPSEAPVEAVVEEQKEEKKEAQTFIAIGNSRKGYQAATRILRPDSFGVYRTETDEEYDVLQAQVDAGFLTKEL